MRRAGRGEIDRLCVAVDEASEQCEGGVRYLAPRREEPDMTTKALLVCMDARPGKEREVEEFLTGALLLVEDEPSTVAWFALRFGPSTVGPFNAFQKTTAGKRTSPARSPRRSWLALTSSSLVPRPSSRSTSLPPSCPVELLA
jgi:hypothetical protein